MHRAYILEQPGATKAVLMIHGICSTPRHFDWLLPTFDESWSVYNILLDGHGGSVKDFGRTSMKKWKAQTQNVLKDLCSRYETVLLVGFSMGTLLQMYALPAYPQVKGLFFMNVPMYPKLSLTMMLRSLRLSFGKPRLQDPHEAACAADAGVVLTKKLWQYLSWLPRFWELLQLSRYCRKHADQVQLPCYAYFGKRDEVVALRSAKFFAHNPHAITRIFDTAGHFWYAPQDRQTLLQDLEQLIGIVEIDKNIS